jgi:hypothetical protein
MDRAAWKPFALGMATTALVAGVLILAQGDDDSELAARAAREKEVAAQAAPAQAALEPNVEPSMPYDVEATLRAVRELDLAVKQTGSVREFLERVSRGDYRRVAPKVLATRKRLVDVLVKYYAALDRERDEQELWGTFSKLGDELARVLQTTDIALGPVAFSPSDPQRQRVLAEERARREKLQLEAAAEIRRFEEELLLALDAAVPVFREVEDEWARLCAQRDRAYLYMTGRDSGAAARAARTALEMAPGDRESTLLLALALVESENGSSPSERGPEVERLLDGVLHDDPDCAPALLLRGIWRWKHGDQVQARADLELAMTRYPVQAEALRDELDPYALREYLRKTRQGGRVTGLYRTMMLGANHFSPELQLARLELEAGSTKDALERVKDHFSRRRAQGQWDLVLYDLEFCEDLLGPRYREYFPEKSYLDLVIETRAFREAVAVSIDNRSDRAIHNAALVLAVRFTDMVEGEYEAFTAGETQAELPPLRETEFGEVELTFSGLGVKKTYEDVVRPVRAVLISDEGVFWIDSIAHKGELARASEAAGAAQGELATRVREVLAKMAPESVGLERVKNLLSGDDLELSLPRELLLLGPLFRLDIGGESFDEAAQRGARSRLEGGRLRLRFESVGRALDGAPQEVRIVAHSALGDFALVLARNEAGNYAFSRIEQP